MTIKPFTAGTYVSDRNAANIASMKSRLDTLSTQLATQRTADSYGGLGAGRTTSLSAHATLSSLDGYDAAINGASVRVNLASASITQVATLGDEVRSALASAGTFGSGGAVDNSIKIARSNLDSALDALNQQAAGRYLFGGRETDKPPVASSDVILNGDPSLGLDGLKAVIAERKTADGTLRSKDANLNDVIGGLTVEQATAGTFSLSEGTNEANRANFGFILQKVVSSNQSAISVTPTAAVAPTVTPVFETAPIDGDIVRVTINQDDGSQKLVDYKTSSKSPLGPNEFASGAGAAASLTTVLSKDWKGKTVAAAQSGTPPGISLAFAGGTAASDSIAVSAATPPAAGDTVTVTLGLRDGTSTTITLTAKASDPLGVNEFRINTDPALTAAQQSQETAKSLQSKLAAALDKSATTTLAASSSVLASQDFFAGSKQAAFAPRRWDEDNGGFVSQPADPDNSELKKTVIWYTGDDTAADPRTTATVQVDANRKVGIGAQANEAPIQKVLAGIAALAAESFSDPTNGTVENARYQELTERTRTVLTSSRAADSIESIASDLSLAAKNMADAKTQNSDTRAVLENTLDGIDTVDTNAVTVALLSLQTQLQASYQVTSTLSKLSLVNYMN